MPLRSLKSKDDVRALGHLRLWRDDLAAIVKLIEEAGLHTEGMTVDEEYGLDSIDDLADLPTSEIGAFEFTCHAPDDVHPALEVHLSRKKAALKVNNPDMAVRGLASEIQRTVENKQRIFGGVALPSATLLTLVSVPLIIYSELADWPASTQTSIGAALVVSAIIAMGVLVGRSYPTKGSAIIYKQTRVEAPPWILRNKDQLITNAVVSAVFLALGFLLGKL